MIVGVYQQCKYNIKNVKNWLCIFVFLNFVFILTKSWWWDDEHEKMRWWTGVTKQQAEMINVT